MAAVATHYPVPEFSYEEIRDALDQMLVPARSYMHLDDDVDYRIVRRSLAHKITTCVAWRLRSGSSFLHHYHTGPDYYPIFCKISDGNGPNACIVQLCIVDNDTVLAVRTHKTVFPALVGSLYLNADHTIQYEITLYVVKKSPPYADPGEDPSWDPVAASKYSMRKHDQILKCAPPEILPYIAPPLLHFSEHEVVEPGSGRSLSCSGLQARAICSVADIFSSNKWFDKLLNSTRRSPTLGEMVELAYGPAKMLHWLHQTWGMHGDISVNNILLFNNNDPTTPFPPWCATVDDYDLARKRTVDFLDSPSKDYNETPYWSRCTTIGLLSTESDCWGMWGVLLYLFYGPPSLKFFIERDSLLSPSFKNFVLLCLQVELHTLVTNLENTINTPDFCGVVNGFRDKIHALDDPSACIELAQKIVELPQLADYQQHIKRPIFELGLRVELYEKMLEVARQDVSLYEHVASSVACQTKSMELATETLELFHDSLREREITPLLKMEGIMDFLGLAREGFIGIT